MSAINNLTSQALSPIHPSHLSATSNTDKSGHNNIDKLINKTLDEVKTAVENGNLSNIKLMDMPDALIRRADQNDDHYLKTIKNFMDAHSISSMSFVHTDEQGKIDSVRTLEFEEKDQVFVQHKYEAQPHSTEVDYSLNYLEKADEIEEFCTALQQRVPKMVTPENYETHSQHRTHETAPAPVSVDTNQGKKKAPVSGDKMSASIPLSQSTAPKAAKGTQPRKKDNVENLNNKINNKINEIKTIVAPAVAAGQKLETIVEIAGNLRKIKIKQRAASIMEKRLTTDINILKRAKTSPSSEGEKSELAKLKRQKGRVQALLGSLKSKELTLRADLNALSEPASNKYK
ncbi:hypothetical protein LLQ46_19950 [Rouxiella badensis]|uniref:hypothetical protein n=1 Tax=Rouxiella badensis TaxID=1646377 RepID=UPI001B4B6595|nr:hypothetical protein [Rouxiella badensis]MCC3749134.1 hypothetical protein [Rouxiella badensis]